MEKNNNEGYINIDDAAKFLGIKTVTLRNWIKNEKCSIPAYKVGRMWKFKRSELDKWVNSGQSIF